MARPIPAVAGGILSYFTRHRTAANLLLVLMVVAGLVAAPNMRAQFFPDVVVDDVTVSVIWRGAGAEDVDAAIVQVLDSALLAVEGVAKSTSSSSEGRASIRLEFEPGWDMGRAAEDVQGAVDGVNTLPSEAEEPTVRRGIWRDRVTDVVITGPVGVDQLARFSDEFVTRLFAEGITRSTVRGVAAPQTLVEVASVNLMAHDVSFEEIAAAIASEVNADPAGDVTGANARVRTGTEKRSPEQIAQIVLRSNADGSVLRLADVARIEKLGVDRDRGYFVGDNPAMTVRVDRSSTGDAIKVQHQVARVAASLQATLPDGVSVDLIRTRAEQISGRLTILIQNGLTGLALVVGLLFLFLNARTAFWVAAGIPVAMLAAVAVMYVAGLTFNMISLFGLIIMLGIVVDDAIVVGEHADARARNLGEEPVQAAENAARRMAMPVLAAMLTTAIAFFGLVSIGGRMGTLISDIPFTVIAVLAASLVECFLILPNHMAHALAHSAKEHWYDLPSKVVNRGFHHFRDRLFRPFTGWVVWARYPVLAGVILLLAVQVASLVRGEVPWRFFNSPEQGSVTGNFAMLPGATRADTLEMMHEMQRAANAVALAYEAEHGRNPIDYMIAEIGGNSGRTLPGTEDLDADLLGGVSIELIDPDLRSYTAFSFVSDLQDEVRMHPLAETVSFRGWRSGPAGEALNVQFFGASAEGLKAASEALRTELARFPEVSAVEDTLSYDKEELILNLTPQGQALGFSIDTLSRALRSRLNGLEAATYPEGPRSASIRVELPEGELTGDFLERMQLRSPAGGYVPLADIVSVESRAGFSTVRRENGLRVITVTGDISEDDPARAEEVVRTLQTEILPTIASERQLEYRLAGLSEQESDFLSDARTGLILCLTGIYLVLAWIFASWTRPIVVMAVIPFGLVGTIWGHAVWDVPMSMFTIVGILGMSGIIINDSIIMVSMIDDHAKDRSMTQAIIDGTADRLRAVLLTTLTTVLGLAPLLYESSSQAQFLKPTVITLVYGLGIGMVLVLRVVPALMAVGQDLSRQVAAFRRGLRLPGLRLPMRGAVVMMLGWLVLTLGWVVLRGDLPAPLAGLLPGAAPMVAALALFVAGLAALVLSLYGLGLARRGQRRRAA